jgi:hypothetical protein
MAFYQNSECFGAKMPDSDNGTELCEFLSDIIL